jgi:hypothetical protein
MHVEGVHGIGIAAFDGAAEAIPWRILKYVAAFAGHTPW